MADEEGRRLTGAVLVVLEQQGIQVQPWQMTLLQQALVTELRTQGQPIPANLRSDKAKRDWMAERAARGKERRAPCGSSTPCAHCGCTAITNCEAHAIGPRTADGSFSCTECGEATPCMNHDPASTWQDRSWSDPVTIEGEALAGQPKGWAPCGCTADSNCNAHGHKPATAWDQRVEAVIEAAGKTECRYCGETGPRCPH